jgi:hypothetical protein
VSTSEFASKMRLIVDLLIESINDQNKSCYTHIVDRNRNSESASKTRSILISSLSQSLDSESASIMFLRQCNDLQAHRSTHQ